MRIAKVKWLSKYPFLMPFQKKFNFKFQMYVNMLIKKCFLINNKNRYENCKSEIAFEVVFSDPFQKKIFLSKNDVR